MKVVRRHQRHLRHRHQRPGQRQVVLDGFACPVKPSLDLQTGRGPHSSQTTTLTPLFAYRLGSSFTERLEQPADRVRRRSGLNRGGKRIKCSSYRAAPGFQASCKGQRPNIVRRIQERFVLAHRGTPAFFDQAPTEQDTEATARLDRVDRQRVFIPVGKQKQRVRPDQIASLLEAPCHLSTGDRLDRDGIGELRYIAMRAGAGHDDVLRPAPARRAAANVWRLLQVNPSGP